MWRGSRKEYTTLIWFSVHVIAYNKLNERRNLGKNNINYFKYDPLFLWNGIFRYLRLTFLLDLSIFTTVINDPLINRVLKMTLAIHKNRAHSLGNHLIRRPTISHDIRWSLSPLPMVQWSGSTDCVLEGSLPRRYSRDILAWQRTTKDIKRCLWSFLCSISTRFQSNQHWFWPSFYRVEWVGEKFSAVWSVHRLSFSFQKFQWKSIWFDWIFMRFSDFFLVSASLWRVFATFYVAVFLLMSSSFLLHHVTESQRKRLRVYGRAPNRYIPQFCWNDFFHRTLRF